jgi:hypothetical protein
MKMKSISLLSLFVLLFTISAVAGVKEDKKKIETPAGAIGGGIVYSLPRTGIRIFVEATQEKYFHGPYYEYALKYLGVRNAPSTDGENWNINGVKLETFGTPDPAEIHKASGAVASMLSLSEEGMLMGINSEVKGNKGNIYSSEFTQNIDLPKQIWSDVSMHSFLTSKDSTKRSGAKFKSFEEKAAEAAQDIIKLRKRKANILAAKYKELPPDGKAYEVMVSELDKIIDDYMALFVGKSFKAKHSYTFEVIPELKASKGIVAFRFSPSAGVLPESNVSGKPIMLDLDPNTDLTRNSSQSAGQVETSTSGLFYRVPGFATARLLYGSDILAQAHLSIAQFGVVTPIPESLLNGDYKISLHPSTGAIQRIGQMC